jgi:UDP-N-acetyl-2-amino-2-deoxyglucuronate dehydrogenase
MADEVRVGIAGLGGQGLKYADLIADGRIPQMAIGATFDVDLAKEDVSKSKFPGVPFYCDYGDLLGSGDVDAVIICVPHYLHPELGIAALERDIHVLIEKPAGVYTKQVNELNAAAASKPRLTFAIMFNQRHNPLYRTIKEIVDSGQIGAIRHTSWIITTWWRPQVYYDQSAWRGTWGGEGGGVLVNQAPHQLDLWQWICGVPVSVYAKVAYGFRRNVAVEDEVTALVDYGGGATGVFVTATHDLVGTDRLEILGDSGKLVIDNSRTARVTLLREPERQLGEEIDMPTVWRLVSGQENTDPYYTSEVLEFESTSGEGHVGVLKNFAANILDGEPLIAPGLEGINGVRLANAIYLSSWKGAEVPLDFDDDEYLSELNRRIAEEGMFPTR